MEERVVLVNAQDEEIGTMEKMEAHRRGVLHRAFSVFIFNGSGQMLLQQRAFSKYHSAGLFTNACCSHPRPGETTADAATRRLFEEMGLTVPLRHHSHFIYESHFENGLTEHEFDHVFTGTTDADPEINPEEVASFKWMDVAEIKKQIFHHPEQFTTWFRIAVKKLF